MSVTSPVHCRYWLRKQWRLLWFLKWPTMYWSKLNMLPSLPSCMNNWTENQIQIEKTLENCYTSHRASVLYYKVKNIHRSKLCKFYENNGLENAERSTCQIMNSTNTHTLYPGDRIECISIACWFIWEKRRRKHNEYTAYGSIVQGYWLKTIWRFFTQHDA